MGTVKMRSLQSIEHISLALHWVAYMLPVDTSVNKYLKKNNLFGYFEIYVHVKLLELTQGVDQRHIFNEYCCFHLALKFECAVLINLSVCN